MKRLFSNSSHRILSLIVAAAIMLSGIPLPAAAESGCTHEHDMACGYIEAAPCAHECGEDCAEGCVHEHDEACGYIEGADCVHEHDADCGDRSSDGGLEQDSTPEPDDGEAATPGNTNSSDDDVPTDNIPLGYSVVAFAELANEVKNQSTTPDTALEALTLPDSLNATVSDGETETDSSINGVTWQSEPEYAAVTIGALEIVPVGTYVFTPELRSGYDLADGVSLPAITVAVQPMGIAPATEVAEGATEWTDGQTVSAQTITGGTITVTGEVTVTGKLTISGNVTITGGGTLLRGGDYKGTLIFVYPGALTLENITIDGNKGVVIDATGALVSTQSALIMNNGATLQNNTGGGVDASFGTFTMNGGTISVNTDISGGGVNNSGTFTMNGGTILGNTADSGGGVYNSGTFTMNGGTISGNTSAGDSGGGVSNSSTFNMSGGTISGNTATNGGGGVWNTFTFNMSGGTISGNTATNNGGGVWNAFTFNISGSPKIENNIKGAGNAVNTGGVYWESGATITIASPLSAGARIGIEGISGTPSTGTKVATGAAESDLQYFYISNATGLIGTNNGFVFDSNAIKLGTVQQFYVSNGGSGTGTQASPFGTIAAAYAAIGTRGEILVTDTITASALISLTGTKTVTLKSSGDTQTIKRGATGVLITVNSGVTLILDNITIDGGNKDGGAYVASGGGSLVNVASGGSFTMNDDATLRNNTYSGGGSYGGGVYISGGTFTMSGGTISGNTASNGGGVYNSGTFTMSGGTVSVNTASGVSGSGGGVYIGSGTFTMSGGTISGNTTSDSGGGVNINNGTFTMSGTALISGNTAGGGVGGGVNFSYGTFTMSGGTISGNTAGGNGGGVFGDGTFTISGSTKIENNIKGSGADTGGVYLNGGKTITIASAHLTSGARIGLEGMWSGTTVATGAVEDDLQYFYISNATGTITPGYGSSETYNSFEFDSASSKIQLETVKQVYVSSGGSGDGTKDSPFGTIADAYAAIGTRGEILVVGPDPLTASALISLTVPNPTTDKKTVTIKSDGATPQTIKRGKAGDLITVKGGVTLILENITIDGGNKDGRFPSGGGTLVSVTAATATLTMNNGTTLQNNTYSGMASGGGVLNNGGTFIMTGGEISYNTAGSSGGGVYNYSGTFTMSGGTISGNTAGGGGGVLNDGTFNMSGSASISGNSASGYGGGVYLGSGTFTMSGGTISDNMSSTGGGVLVSGGSFTVGGTAKITGNPMSGAANNVYLLEDCYITLGTGANGAPVPASGMEIYVTKTANSGMFVEFGAIGTDTQYFHADNTALTVEYAAPGKLKLAAKPLTPLTQVTGAALSATGQATWTNLAPETGLHKYGVYLYKNGSDLGIAKMSNPNTGDTGVSFLSEMRAAGVGSYTVVVKAIGNGTTHSDGAASAASSAQTVAKLPTPTSLAWSGVNAMFNKLADETNVAKYSIEINGTGTVGGGNAADVAKTGSNLSVAVTSPANGDTFTVKAIAPTTGLWIDSDAATSAAYIAPTYILAWDGTPGDFADLAYGYTTGSSVTYTIENTGNQTVSGITAAISTGSSNFEITTSPAASLVAGETATVTVTSKTGFDASSTSYGGTLTVTWSGGSGTTGITQSLSQVVNKAAAPTGVNKTVEAVINNAKPYSFDLTTLLPASHNLTGITYAVKAVSNGDGVLSTAPSGTVASPLSLNVASISATGKTATVTITVSSDNHADFDAVITVTTVAKIPLTVTGLTVSSKVYDGTTAATLSGTATLVGVVGGDVVSLTGTPSAVFADANAGTGKTVTITGLSLAGANANKYSLDLSDIKGTITAKTPTASDLTYSLTAKTYNGLAQPVSVTKQDSSLGAITVKYGGNTTAPTNAGTYAVTVDIAGSTNFSAATGLSLGNYVISKVQLTVTAENKGITYGAAPPIYTAAYTGFVNSETSSVLSGSPAFACSYTQGGNVTTYTITPSTGTLSATNYSFSFASGTLTVGQATQAALTITGTPATVTYGDTFTLGTTGGSGNGAVSFAVTSGGSYATVNSSSGAVTITGVGSVTITATKAADANHSAAVTATTTFTSVKRNLSNTAVSVSGTYTYTGSAITPAPTVTDSGATIASSDWEIDAYSNNINAGTATVTVKATSGGNYTGAKTANFTINPANVTTAALTVTPPATGAAKTDASVGVGANYTHTSTAWTITGTSTAAGTNFAASTAYTATITLTTKANYVFGTVPTGSVTGAGGTVMSAETSPDKSTLTIVVNYPATAAKQVISIDVTAGPTKTTYYSGDTLNVAGLVVTATYDDGTTGAVTPSGYAINGKTFTPGATLLTAAQNGWPITVKYNVYTDTTANIAVKTPPVISNVTVSDITASTAAISYTATKGTDTITVNKLEYKTGSGSWTAATNGSPITGLASGTVYQYRITVSDGTKEVSRSGSFQTQKSGSTGVTVSGTVTDPSNPSSITVTIEHGNTVIASVTASGIGTYNFSFSGIPNGIYNLVSDNGSYKVTQAVPVSGADVTGVNIAMTQGNTQSVVDIVTPDTPPASVSGLPELFEDAAGILEQADKDIITGGGTVEIKLAVEQKDNPGDANVITGAASGQTVGLYLDLSILKSHFDNTGALLDESKLTDLNGNLITINFELPDNLKGKTRLIIYRVHNNQAEALSATPNADGETAVISGDIVTLNVCKFSTYAIAYTPKNPVNPPGSSSGRGSSGGSSGAETSTVASTYLIEAAETKTMAKAAKEKGLDFVRSSRAGITSISKNALRVLAGLRYRHDTVDGNAVQVRVYIDDPAKATKDIFVSGYVKGDTADKIKAKFGKWFTNKIAVVSFDQQGDFGMVVRIAAKADLSGMDTNNLYFYGYDRKTNKYSRINTEYRIDGNGYLHFATILAGDVIVSNGPLKKKTGEQIAADGDKYYYLAETPSLESLNINGNVSEPPSQESPKNPNASGESLSYMNATDAPLKLEKVDSHSRGGALVIDLDAPLTQDTLNETLKRDKISVYGVIGITSVLLLAAMMLWAAIPRKDDPLVSVEEYRKKH